MRRAAPTALGGELDAVQHQVRCAGEQRLVFLAGGLALHAVGHHHCGAAPGQRRPASSSPVGKPAPPRPVRPAAAPSRSAGAPLPGRRARAAAGQAAGVLVQAGRLVAACHPAVSRTSTPAGRRSAARHGPASSGYPGAQEELAGGIAAGDRQLSCACALLPAGLAGPQPGGRRKRRDRPGPGLPAGGPDDAHRPDDISMPPSSSFVPCRITVTSLDACPRSGANADGSPAGRRRSGDGDMPGKRRPARRGRGGRGLAAPPERRAEQACRRAGRRPSRAAAVRR